MLRKISKTFLIRSCFFRKFQKYIATKPEFTYKAKCDHNLYFEKSIEKILWNDNSVNIETVLEGGVFWEMYHLSQIIGGN